MRVIIFFAGVAALFSWVFMILIGIVHIHWLHSMPTIGYGGALAISLSLSVVALIASGVLRVWAWLMGLGEEL